MSNDTYTCQACGQTVRVIDQPEHADNNCQAKRDRFANAEVEYQGPKVAWVGSRGKVDSRQSIASGPHVWVDWYVDQGRGGRALSGWFKRTDLKVVERAIDGFKEGDRIIYTYAVQGIQDVPAGTRRPGWIEATHDREDGSRALIINLGDGSQLNYSTERDDTPGLEKEPAPAYPGALPARWRTEAQEQHNAGIRAVLLNRVADELEAALNAVGEAQAKAAEAVAPIDRVMRGVLTGDELRQLQDATEANREN